MRRKRGRSQLLIAAAAAIALPEFGLCGLWGHADAQSINAIFTAVEDQNSINFITSTVGTPITIPVVNFNTANYDAADTRDSGTIWNALIAPTSSSSVFNTSGSPFTFQIEANLPLINSVGAPTGVSISEIDFTVAKSKNDTVFTDNISGTLAGNDGLFTNPPTLMNQAWDFGGNGESMTMTFTGLNTNTNYNFYFYGAGNTPTGRGATVQLPAAFQPAGYAPQSTNTDSTAVFHSVFDGSGTNPAPERGLSWNVVNFVTDSGGNVVIGITGSTPNTGQKGFINGFQIDMGDPPFSSFSSLVWDLPGSGAWDTLGNWNPTWFPSSVDDVTIAPINSLTVTGPAGSAVVNSLLIGGGGGNATLALQEGGNLTVSQGLAIRMGGSLVSSGANVTATSLMNSGTIMLNGNATINGSVTNSGSINLTKAGAGKLTANGYTQTANGSLTTIINGAAASGNFDSIVVNGSASLGGQIAVTLGPTFGGGANPSSSDKYPIVVAQSVTGAFAPKEVQTTFGSNGELAGLFNVNYSGNSANLSDFASVLTLANLSYNIYSGTSGTNGFSYITNVPEGSDSTNPGFLANAYTTSDHGQIVIAFRGTQLNNGAATAAQNLLADASFVTTVNWLLEDDVKDAVDFVRAVKNDYPGANIILTGHSLGGALAQLIGEASGLNAIAFDAPGAQQLYGQLNSDLQVGSWGVVISNATTNTNFRLYDDQVSQAGTPTGVNVTLQKPTSIVVSPNPSIPGLELLQNLNSYLQLHDLGTLISQIINSAPVVSTAGELNDVQSNINVIRPVTAAVETVGSIDYFFTVKVPNELKALFDPSAGSDYLLTGQAGSPNLTSIALPTLPGVASYNVRYEQGGVWSSYQSIQPGDLDVFGGGSTGVEFNAVDSSGQGVTLPEFLFEANFDSTGTFLGTLTEAGVSEAASVSLWNEYGGGSWASVANWSSLGVPHQAQDVVTFGASNTAAAVVTLDSGWTVGTVNFASSNSYTLAPGTNGSLTLDSGSTAASINVSSGSHVITAPIFLNSDLLVSVANAGNTLSLSGSVTGNHNLTVSGMGTLVLSGSINIGGSEYIGYNGTGNFYQTGGTNTAGNVYLSDGSAYIMTGGTLSCAAFNQTGGTASFASLSLDPGDVGAYHLSGGATIVGNLYVGGSNGGPGGTGALTVSGGVLSVGGTLTAYNISGSSINLAGGTINAAALNLNGVPSLFNWTSGTLNLASNITVGGGGLLGSSITLVDGQTLGVTGGNVLNVTGTLNLNGGTINVGNLTNSRQINWASGAINITNSDLVVGSGGPLGTTISLAGGQTLGVIGPHALNIAGTLNLNGGTINSGSLTGSGQLNWNSGTINITNSDLNIGNGGLFSSDLMLTDGQTLGVNATYSLNVPGIIFLNGGTLNAANVISGGIAIGTNEGSIGAFAVSGGNVIVGGSVYVGGSSSISGGTGFLTVSNTGQLSVGGTLKVWNNGQISLNANTTTVGNLAIAGNGIVNLNGALTINYGSTGNDPVASVVSYLKSGYDNGNWTGTSGIISTSITGGSPALSIGYADGNTDSGTAAGPNQIVIKYTLAGDANLDGFVNFGDLVAVIQNFNKAGTDWAHGNFAYGASTNFGDLVAVIQNFNKTLPPPSGSAVDLGSSTIPIVQSTDVQLPEPTGIALGTVVAAGALGRRRRKEFSPRRTRRAQS